MQTVNLQHYYVRWFCPQGNRNLLGSLFGTFNYFVYVAFIKITVTISKNSKTLGLIRTGNDIFVCSESFMASFMAFQIVHRIMAEQELVHSPSAQ